MHLSTVTSPKLPISIVKTDKADEYYESKLYTQSLSVRYYLAAYAQHNQSYCFIILGNEVDFYPISHIINTIVLNYGELSLTFLLIPDSSTRCH